MKAQKFLAFLFLLLFFCPVGPAWAVEVGQVISLTPGGFALRDGNQVPLALKDPVHDTDTLITDAAGRMQVLFSDDSTVSLAPNTNLALREVVPTGEKPAFKAHVGQGVARFITGKIVEQNPGGFALDTPEATVGIRGTIFVVQVGNGKTTVFVLNTTRTVTVNSVTVPSGFKITLPSGKPEPMTPADMDLTSYAALAGGAQEGGEGQEAAAGLDIQGGTALFVPETLTQPDLTRQAVADSLQPLGTVLVSGTMSNTNLPDAAQPFVGTFSFSADLATGAISNASMAASGIIGDMVGGGSSVPGMALPSNYSLSGGSGQISGNSMSVSGFSGPTDYRGMVSSISPPSFGSASMSGTATQSSSGLQVNGNYAVDFSGGGYQDHGTFSGQSN